MEFNINRIVVPPPGSESEAHLQRIVIEVTHSYFGHY